MSNSLGSIRGVVKNGQKCVEINSDIADVKGNLTVSGGDLKVGGTGIEHIQDIYGVTGEKAGGAVSLSNDGTIFAIGGDQFDGNNKSNNGRVRIFKYNGTTWTQLGNDIYGENSADRIGSLYSKMVLSGDGLRVAIPSAYNSGGGSGSEGQVRIFEYNGTDWIQLGNSIYGHYGDTVNHGGGTSVPISISEDGNVVAIYGSGIGQGFNGGKIRVFEYNGTDWIQLGGNILGVSDNSQGESGVNLSNNGRILSAGAPRHDNLKGCVRIYQYNGTSWSQLGGDIVGDNNADYFAENSLSADGTIVAIASIYHTFNGNNYTGLVKVYQYIGSAWTQIGSNIYGEEAYDYLSRPKLSKDGNTLLVSGWGGNQSAGYIKLFENIDGTWTQIGKITGDSTLDNSGQLRLGISSALSGDGRTFAASSPYADIDNNTNTGIAKIYQYNKKGNLTTGRIQFFQTNTEVAGGDTASILNRFNTVINIPTTDSDGNALTADTTYEMTTGPAGSINNISFVKKNKTIFQASFPSQTSLAIINETNNNPYILGNNYSSISNVNENGSASSGPFLWNVQYDIGPSAQGNTNGPLVFTCMRSGYYKINVDGTVRDESTYQPTDYHQLFVYHHRGATETQIAQSRGGESAPQQGSYYSRQALGMNFIYLLQIGDALDIRVAAPRRGGEQFDRFYLENGTITINVVSLD